MFSKSLRTILFCLVTAALASCAGFSAGAQTQSMQKAEQQIAALGTVTGTLYEQPVDPSGKLYLSAWIDPDGTDFDQYIWDNFTLLSNETLTDIKWTGGYDPLKNGMGGSVVDFTVAIYPSIAAGTEPAVANPPLATYQTGGNAGETSIGMVGSIEMFSYTFNLPVPFSASAGVKYWVHIKAFQHGSSPDWGLAAGTGGNSSHYRWGAGAGGDSGFRSVPGDVTFTLLGPVPEKITPTVTWSNPADIIYGTALSETQLNATASVPGTFVYNPPLDTILDAGVGQTLSVDFMPTDSTNYNSVFGTTVTINVNKATPTVIWSNPADITYGTVLSGTQLNATASVPGTFSYTPASGTVLNAGAGQSLSVDFTPTESVNYNSVPGTTVTINVNKATPIVTWANLADITYGTPLSGTQLNAAASVPGDFVYSPAAGTVLNVGAGQILSVDFSPTDSNNYNSVLNTIVTINVNDPTPTNTSCKVTGGGNIDLANGGKITFGFVVQYDAGAESPSGNLTFMDHTTQLSLKGFSFTLLCVSDTQARITGYATVDGASTLSFILDLYDYGEPGSSDEFTIQIPALNGYSAGGVLTGGNIQITRP